MQELLALRDVRLHYWRGKRHVVQALDGVSLRLWPGEVVCVLAGHGQGKTTLLRVAAGVLEPATGQVLFDGRDLWALSVEERAELLTGQIAFVGDAPPELHAAVLDYIALAVTRKGETQRDGEARAARALERVGIAECARLTWDSLDDRERALVSLARGIAQEPRLLLLDSLTVGLELVYAEEIGRLVYELARERDLAVLATVASASETTWSDRIATLAGGELLVTPKTPEQGRGQVIGFPDGGRGGRRGG
jgi:ABC-type cobalamin/Fe3+-siderophores transport system ATPase subunit